MCGIIAALLADRNSQLVSAELCEGLGILQHRGQVSVISLNKLIFRMLLVSSRMGHTEDSISAKATEWYATYSTPRG